MVFVESSVFSSQVYKYLSDDEYIILQNELATNPNVGNIIPGTSGLRKIRFRCPLKGKGKRSGVRIIYYWYTGKDSIYLLSIYYKGEVGDLTPSDKKILKQLVEVWKSEET